MPQGFDASEFRGKIRAYCFFGPNSQKNRIAARWFLRKVRDDKLGNLVSAEEYESRAGTAAFWVIIETFNFDTVEQAYDAAIEWAEAQE